MDDLTLIKAKKKDQKAISSGDKTKIKKVFGENTKLLKEFIKKNGWPIKEKYSAEASSAAWLIAQHSDHDPMFQLQCLSLIIANSYSEDKELMQDIAFLLDRVLINMNQKQVFGTQLNGKFSVPNTISPNNLDSLRKKIGLESMNHYIERVKKFAEKQEG
ncbi:MAG: DUF6624 domain-containing protein [Nanoarchaeota archaeon]